MIKRNPHRRALAFDSLEGKALLATVTVYPFGHPNLARKIRVADNSGTGNLDNSDQKGNPAGGTTDTNTGTGTGSGSGASGGSQGGTGATNGPIAGESFRQTGARTRYRLRENAAGFAFDQVFTQ